MPMDVSQAPTDIKFIRVVPVGPHPVPLVDLHSGGVSCWDEHKIYYGCVSSNGVEPMAWDDLAEPFSNARLLQ